MNIDSLLHLPADAMMSPMEEFGHVWLLILIPAVLFIVLPAVILLIVLIANKKKRAAQPKPTGTQNTASGETPPSAQNNNQ